MSEKKTQNKGLTSAPLLIEMLTPVLERVDYGSQKILFNKYTIYDLLRAVIFLLRYACSNEKEQHLYLEYARGLVGSALARLNDHPLAFYKVEVEVDGRTLFNTRVIPESVDPEKYIEAIDRWRNRPPSLVRSIQKLTPDEVQERSVRTSSPLLNDQGKWILEQCQQSGITDGLMRVIGYVDHFVRQPPANTERFVLSFVRKSRKQTINPVQYRTIQQFVGGDSTTDVWVFGNITFVLVQGKVRCFMPARNINFPDGWEKQVVKILPSKSGITFQVLKAELESSSRT